MVRSLVGCLMLAALAVSAAPARASETGASLPLEPERQLRFTTREGTWLSLDVTPDGETIVFELLGDLYRLESAGGTARAMTHGLPFDSQPVVSPDGERLAFVSDRSGNENLWVARADGSSSRQLSFLDDNTRFVSPAWAADGRSLFVSRYQADVNAFELWRYPFPEGPPVQLTKARPSPGTPADAKKSALGAVASPDGRFVYYATRTGSLYDEAEFPVWSIERLDLAGGDTEIVITHPGSALRPVLSPNGRTLVYGARFDGQTGLRTHDLATGTEEWLVWPVTRDSQEHVLTSRDVLPGYDFTPDGKALLLTIGGGIRRVDLDDGEVHDVPFTAEVSLDLGPSLRRDIPEETGPVRARLIQAPVQSPDGRQLAFSALARVYVMPLAGSVPRRLTDSVLPEFHPSWSPDGETVVYLTWRAESGGQLWIAPADGAGAPERLTDRPNASYRHPVFTPDGKRVLALRADNRERLDKTMEFGLLHEAELVEIDLASGQQRVVVSGTMGGVPHFVTGDTGHVYLNFRDGLNRVALDGSGREAVASVRGPGWYFVEGSVPVDDLRISPDGEWLLAQIAQQLHLLAMPEPQGGDAPVIELSDPTVYHRKLTQVGADFFGWANGGRTVTWAVGSTFYRAGFELPPTAAAGEAPGRIPLGPVESFAAVVERPRDLPRGTLLLRGATAITMDGDEILRDADILIRDNRIAAIGVRGDVDVPAGTPVRDLQGRYVVPGFIDTHLHWGTVRRDVLDVGHWSFPATLAWGVTSGLDVSSLSIDIFAYHDLIDAGMMLGPRAYSTGTALFSFNEFESSRQALQVLRRYRDHYRTRNLKMYRTGNRQVRQWVAQAAQRAGMMPTTEGALDTKLGLTMIMDGYAGLEHAIPAAPIYRDVVELLARSGTSYTATLVLPAAGPEPYDKFIIDTNPHADPKVRRFFPHAFIDARMTRRSWRAPQEYAYPLLAQGVAAVQRAGGLVGMGSHGNIVGLGYHWELQAHAAGGMTPHEILRAATIGSAATIGRAAFLGSLEAGKLADLLVLGENPLADIANTQTLELVMKNGRLYDADDLAELWPRERPGPAFSFSDDLPVGSAH